MTRTEHLLFILAEECGEVAQRASRAARFGMAEVQPGQPLTNGQRLVYEVADLIAVYQVILGFDSILLDSEPIRAKRAKVEKFLAYARECGTLDTPGDATG